MEFRIIEFTGTGVAFEAGEGDPVGEGNQTTVGKIRMSPNRKKKTTIARRPEDEIMKRKRKNDEEKNDCKRRECN